MNILLVDDESYVTESLELTIPWTELGIEEVYRADSVDQALATLNKHDIDIVVTDIRMPDRDGLELLAEIGTTWPHIRTLVLTGYSDFEYAQKAIRLKAGDYILKPVDDDPFMESIRRVVNEIEAEWGQTDKYNQLAYQRQSELEVLRDGLLNDLLLGREASDRTMLSRLETYDIRIKPDHTAQMLFVPPGSYTQDQTEEAIRLLEYAIGNITNEILGAHGAVWLGRAPQGGLVILWQYDAQIYSGYKLHIRELRDSVHRYLKTNLSFWVSDPFVFPMEMSSTYRHMMRFAHLAYAAAEQGIHFIQEQHQPLERPSAMKFMESLYKPPALIHLLESAQWNAAKQKVDQVLDTMESLPLTHEHLYEVYLAVSNALVYMAHHHGYKLAASDSGGLDPFSAQQITGSLSRLRLWCNSVLTRIELQGTPSALEPSRSRIVKQVQEMVAESLGQDVSVKTIADRVFLHPVYLSKIYKTETGEGLGDYIIRIRMEKALYMLKHTNSKIYEITAALGYQNPQYFSKLFKKHYGMTPNEFRET